MFDLQDELKAASIDIWEAKNSDDKAIYAINTSDLNGKLQRGELVLKFKKDGTPFSVHMKDTWIPRNLTNYVPKDMLLTDYEFIRLVERGLITLIKTTVAEEILKTPEAIVEANRLKELENKLTNAGAQAAEKMERLANESKARDAIIQTSEMNKALPSQPTGPTFATGQQNIRVVTIMNNKGIDEVTKMAALARIANELTIADYDFIMNKCERSDVKLKGWVVEAKKRLSSVAA
jgi:hypothetical protein